MVDNLTTPFHLQFLPKRPWFTGLPKLHRLVCSRISFLCGIAGVSWNIPLEDGSIAKLEANMLPHPPLLPYRPIPAQLMHTMRPS